MNRRNVLKAAAAFAALGAAPVAAPSAALASDRLFVQGTRPGRRVLYPVAVNGKALQFIFDSGLAAQAVIKASAAKAAGLTQTGVGSTGDPSGTSRTEAADFSGGDLSVGGRTFRVQSFQELPAMPGMESIDGILGLDLFAGMTLTLDFAAMTLAAEREPLPAQGSLAFTRDPFIVVEARVGDQRLKSHLDTGNGAGAFVVPEATAASLPLAGEARVVGRARTVSAEMEIKAAPLGAPLRMGPFELAATEVRWPSLVPGIANIGGAAFEGRRLSIDLVNQRLLVERV